MRYTLYHKVNSRWQDNRPSELDAFPEGFAAVAIIECDEPGAVFQLSNHIDSNWTTNPEVVELFAAGARSTSVGDVFVAADGRRFSVQGFGLREF